MIALLLIITSFTHINCQQLQPWPSYSKGPQVSVFRGSYNNPGSQYHSNIRVYQGYPSQPTFSSPQLTQRACRSITPASFPSLISPFTYESSTLTQAIPQMPITANLAQRMSKILSAMPKTQQAISTPTPSVEPTVYSSLPSIQYVPTSQTPQSQVKLSSVTPTFSSFPTSATSLTPGSSPTITPTVPSSFKPTRSIIPSPLIETMPQSQNGDSFRNIFELPEPTLGSVGCLTLSMTPYGTITETPLLDPSIPLPRSPFLPVSSPVSALAPPLSPNLPPVLPASRSSTFLRKVPVPPPFL